MTQYCPHTATCPFYKTWSEQTKKREIDVIYIVKCSNRETTDFNCLPLKDLYSRTITNEKLKDRLSNPEESDFACSHITLLNRLENINKNLLEEMNKKRIFIL